MKKLLILLVIVLSGLTAAAQVNQNQIWVDGYYRSDGTYVEGHYRTAPNNTTEDNLKQNPGQVYPPTQSPPQLDGGAVIYDQNTATYPTQVYQKRIEYINGHKYVNGVKQWEGAAKVLGIIGLIGILVGAAALGSM